MRTTYEDWNDIRERLKAGNAPSWNFKDLSADQRQSFLHASQMAFEAGKDSPAVKGLKRFIMGNAKASIAAGDVLYWYIEPTENIEKAFRVCLADGRRFIGTLVLSVAIEGRWVCNEYVPEDAPKKQGMHDDLKDLLFVSNTIELKEDKKYLMVFKGITINQLEHIMKALGERGMDCFGMALHDGQELQVIEAPAKIEPEPDRFWEQLSRDMTINERRAIFKKLGEHLGIDVSEWGEVDDGIKKHYSLDEAKKILGPYIETGDYLS